MPPLEGNQEAGRVGGAGQVYNYVTIRNIAYDMERFLSEVETQSSNNPGTLHGLVVVNTHTHKA